MIDGPTIFGLVLFGILAFLIGRVIHAIFTARNRPHVSIDGVGTGPRRIMSEETEVQSESPWRFS